VCWHVKPWLESGPITADLKSTVVHRYVFLINDVKPVHSLTLTDVSLYDGYVTVQYKVGLVSI